MAREEKVTAIAELREKLGKARGAVLTDFRGLTVADITELRAALRKSQVEYTVVKNTLAKRAVQDTAVAGLSALFEGPTAVAISVTDPVAASKAVTQWAKGRPTFTIKGGAVEGRVVTASDIASLADLPNRQVLLGRLAGVMQAPIAGLARVLAASLSGFANVLDRVRERKETGAA
ncbi:MAG TPA: 50S ribosomal protein L10 [Candidatus Baltobacteraceae bacterium]|nr:50S ribosomal protein L10 [Candidatus Baltobacteraceae bacterium]